MRGRDKWMVLTGPRRRRIPRTITSNVSSGLGKRRRNIFWERVATNADAGREEKGTGKENNFGCVCVWEIRRDGMDDITASVSVCV